MISRIVDAAFASWLRRKRNRYLPCPPRRTALLLVDVQEAHFSASSPGYDLIREVAEATGVRGNLKRLVADCRRRGVSVIHCPLVVSTNEPVPYLRRLRDRGISLEGGADAEIPAELRSEADTVLPARRALNAFLDTGLHDLLQRRGATHLVVVGPVANASVDSTGRMGVELDYHVTFVSDCIAALDADAYRASVEITFPRFAHRVANTDDVISDLAKTP